VTQKSHSRHVLVRLFAVRSPRVTGGSSSPPRVGMWTAAGPRTGGAAAAGGESSRMLPAMKVTALETLFCDAGWRPWIFLKATSDDGLSGWAEITDSHGSPRGLAGVVAEPAPPVLPPRPS